jgi:AcrR family transcriptional regulator
VTIEDRRLRERTARRRLIMATARTLAEHEGWDAVTTRRLSTEIEYSQPVLYKHFASMEEIVEAVALEGFGELADTLGAARRSAGSAQPVQRRPWRGFPKHAVVGGKAALKVADQGVDGGLVLIGDKKHWQRAVLSHEDLRLRHARQLRSAGRCTAPTRVAIRPSRRKPTSAGDQATLARGCQRRARPWLQGVDSGGGRSSRG